MRRTPLCLALAAGLVAACGQTKMLNTWKSPDLRPGMIHKALVIGVFSTVGAREVVEGQFVEQLEQERLEAVASHAFLTDEELGREAVVQKVREQAFDGVVLARILDRQTYDQYYDPAQMRVDVPLAIYDEWYKELIRSRDHRDAVGYTDASRIDSWVETRVFDARTQKLVWSGVSQTKIDGRDMRQIQEAVGAILESMRSDGVF